jgi:hypothetical protein
MLSRGSFSLEVAFFSFEILLLESPKEELKWYTGSHRKNLMLSVIGDKMYEKLSFLI